MGGLIITPVNTLLLFELFLALASGHVCTPHKAHAQAVAP